MRINKYLSMCEIGSRRKVEDLIINGNVSVNGKVVTNLATQVVEGQDVVKVNGNVVELINDFVYIMLNKPKGFITSTSDEKNRPTVMSLVNNVNVKIYPVGRLDYNSQGLLLLTNDGTFANQVIHPTQNLEKEYIVEFSGNLTPEKIARLQKPFILDGHRTMPAKVFNITKPHKGKQQPNIIIFEGKNRQIRKMFEIVDLKVLNLLRIRIGGLRLNKLPLGSIKELNKNERNSIFK